MSFTLTTLKEAINEYTQNTNWGSATGDGTGQINAIIRQAEERINYIVQIANYNTKSPSGDLAEDDVSVTITPDSEVAPIAPVYFKIRTGADVAANAWSYLLLKDYNFLQEYAPVDSSKGTPKYYAFYNDAQDAIPTNVATFAFAPIASGAFDYEILYFFEPTSLIDVTAGTKTWLSTHATNALLYACLVEAYTFMKGEADLMQLYDTKFKEALQTLVMTEQGNYRTSFRDRKRAA